MVGESGFQVGSGGPRYYEAHTAVFMAPFADALVAACVDSGDAVLDVACGTGFAARSAAASVGDEGRIEGVDINPAMISQAKEIARDAGLDIQWREASALDLPYGDGEFDVVICQQGVQFFPDPPAGIREMTRVARPGGRLGITVWAPAHEASFLHLEAEMLAYVLGEPLPPFSAEEKQITGWLADAGIADASVQLLEFDVDLPPLRAYVPQHLKALPWSVEYFGRPEDSRAAAMRELEEAFGHLATDRGVTALFRSYLVVAST